jgi:hypothetical protein
MKKSTGLLGCLPILIILVINLTIGAWSVIEILSWFGKSIPLMGNVVIGLFVGEISIPVALVGWILKISGVF